MSNPDSRTDGCCTPARGGDASVPVRSASDGTKNAQDDNFVDIAGGSFIMGTDEPYRYAGDGEGPARVITLSPYRISRYAVTNRQFAAFVEDTGYRTEAEQYEWSFVFHLFLPDDFPDTRAVAATPWWRQVFGADWSHPAGPQSSLDDVWDHPVIHVSWNDASAYCAWAGVRLPTEAEWEKAARGGLVQKQFVWGDEFSPGGRTMCNIFEGSFPAVNTAEDGYVGTAPVDAFPANGFGLHNVAGNVWEWCSDWFHTGFHASGPRTDPQGPTSGEAKVMRGGSYLCHDSYCHRYRVSARSSNTPDSSGGNLGFRVAADAEVR
ncbi:MAG: formylglycine-generating enzyme family protein [Acidimicrobiales bacterium]